MKKAGFVLCVIMLGCTMLSCAAIYKGMIWDESIPPEQSAKVAFWNFVPESYNGIKFDSKEAHVGGFVFYVITLPAGVATFTGRIEWYSAYTARAGGGYRQDSVIINDLAFSCRLVGGKEYYLITDTTRDEENHNYVWEIHQYDHKIPAVTLPSGEEFLVAIIPFDPPVATKY